MSTPRVDATATLLSNGKVLIAGGNPKLFRYPPVLASAELYDPATGKFTPTGSMKAARSDAAAALLPDGRVLIAGGFGCASRYLCTPADPSQGGGNLASAELYDPMTGEFTPTGSMKAARGDATATLLRDGRVLLLNGGSRLAEIYVPATGKFTPAGSLLNGYIGTYGGYGGPPAGAGSATATLLPDGRVLVVGPIANGHGGGPGAEMFDPATGTSTAFTLDLPPDVVAAADTNGGGSETATLLKDGRILLTVFNFLVTYDPATLTFTEHGAISDPGAWAGPTTTLLPDGEVLFAGGYLGTPFTGETIGASAGLFDPEGGFTMIGSMKAARVGHTATLLLDGTVLIAGGMDDQDLLSSAELFKP